MRIKCPLASRITLLFTLILSLTIAATQLRADTGTCGGQSITIPFTDVPSSNIFFCSIAEAFFSGLTSGTSATTYSPAANVPREQMAAFITRTMEQSLRRGSRRAALGQWWRRPDSALGSSVPVVVVDNIPKQIQCDGTDFWVANSGSNTVSRISGGNKNVSQTWTGATGAFGVAVTLNRIYVTGALTPGRIYEIRPDGTPGPVFTLTSSVGNVPTGIAFDGARLWTGNNGSISMITLGGSVTTVSTGFSRPLGVVYDGDNIWVTDIGDDTLKKLDSNGAILQTISIGDTPGYPVFDGINIWVPNDVPGTVKVVRVKDANGNALASPFVLATLIGNPGAISTAFDGEHVLVARTTGYRIYKAADLSFLSGGGFSSAFQIFGAASDGLGFYITVWDGSLGTVLLL